MLVLLKELVQSYLPCSFNMTVDLASEEYSFPQHIVPTHMHPDIRNLVE